ncbi:phage minor capsid protein [Ruminococcaceae bacterium OttesenSCG-928-A11]|nr:phage minor capsid protein [Ruminococcaceae bacterium OttesenSCG-928-A11]
MRPEEIAALKDIALEVTHPVNEYLIEDICRRVAGAGEMTATAKYQAYRAANLGAGEEAIKQALKKQGILTNQSIDALFKFLVKNTVKFEDNGSLQQLVRGYKKVAQKQMVRMMKNLGVRLPTGEVVPVGKAYGELMDFAFRQVFTGATDYTTALRQATKGLADEGVRYITRGGPKSRTVGIEYATRQNLMTQMGELNQEISQMNHDQLGCNGWEISAHEGSAPDHEPYQGRQFSDAEYKKLNEVTLKRPIGTMSCGHDADGIILGVHSPQYSEAQLRAMRQANIEGVTYGGRHYTLYEASQAQRGLESGIRETKNKILVDRANGDTAQLKENELLLVRQQAEYKRFCKATNQPTQNERLQVAGFGRSEAAAAQAAFRRLTA